MSTSITTQLDNAPISDDTRAAAARIIRATTPDADLILEILGLVSPPPPPPPRRTGVNAGDGTLRCSDCGQRTRHDGICRRARCGGALKNATTT